MTSNEFAVWMLLAAFGAAGAACGDDESAATGTTSSSAAATGSGGDSSTTSTTTTASSMTTTTATGTGGAGTGGAGTGGAGTGGAGTGGAGTGGAGGAGTGGAGGTGTGGAGGAGTGGAGGAGSGGAGGGSGAQLVINEVVPDPVVDGDWVEFFNAGDEAADLTGWTMTDDDPTHVFEFPAGTIVEPGAYLTLEKDLPNSFTFGLGTSGDQVNVYDGDGVVVDSTGWSAGDADLPTSWGRLPNGTGDFQTLAVPTKGTENL